MNRRFTRYVLFVSILLLMGTLIGFNEVHASPATYEYSPTASAASSTIASYVHTAGNAYDWNNYTEAEIEYNKATGIFNMTSLNPPSGYPTGTGSIYGVLFKMRYWAQAASNGRWRLLYYVSPSETGKVLKDWTSIDIADNTQSWGDLGEPNDGTWSWADVGNIKFSIEVEKTGGGGSKSLYIKEAWVTVWPLATMAVDPSSIVDITKTPGSTISVDVNITDGFNVMGYEFLLNYTTPNVVLNCTSSTIGNYFPEANRMVFKNEINNTAGYVWVIVTRAIGQTDGIYGDGKLATITFKVNATGSTNLDLNKAKLSLPTGLKYIPNMSDGFFSNAGAPEFPLGAIAEISLFTVIVYFFWRRKRRSNTARKDTTIIPPPHACT